MAKGLSLSGRVDLVVYTPDVALVIDWKTGYSEPDPAELNAQLKVLAVLVAIALPTVKEVICQIISGPFGITETHFSIAELKVAYDDIVKTLEEINSEYATFSPSPDACRYCGAVLICQAINKIAATQYKVLPEGPGATAVLDECEILERRIKEIRAHYYSALEAGQQIPGWSLQPGPARREVTDWKAARVRLEEFICAEELDALANYSIPTIEKLLARSLKLKASQVSAKLAEILGDLLGVRPANLVLKREAHSNETTYRSNIKRNQIDIARETTRGL